MLGNLFGSKSMRFDDPVVMGLFLNASDAHRALQALHENHYSSDQMTATFRTPPDPRADAEASLAPMRASGQWFGQLREIYRGEDSGVNRTGAVQTEAEASTTGFEAMLSQVDLSPQDRLTLDHDFERSAAIVTVRAAARNAEARALLEKWGARIVQARQAGEPARTAEPPSATTTVHSTPFNPPEQTQPDHVQLFGEVLRVRKEKVSTGDVNVRKEAVTHMETVQVPVTREHLVVERADGREGEHAIRVPLSEERVHIDKDTVLREEYKVGKRELTQNELLTDTVRRERLLIDDASVKANN